MDWKFVIALIFAVIVAVFAVQNAATVDINFFTAELVLSQALVILISAMLGALVVAAISLVRQVKLKSKIRALSKTISTLEDENKKLNLKIGEQRAQQEPAASTIKQE